jgi:curved DNA-binding protein CbpA
MMSEFTDDAYAILGVDSKTATTKDIKTAYRKLALLYHPDRHTDPDAKAKATQTFAKIANAYEILSDDHLRAEYDRSRPDPSPMSSSSSKKKNNYFSTSSSSPNQSSADDNTKPPPFRYHFSDPYEVFKRDFREQFGIEYPGAQYDWVDFDTPIFVHPEQQRPAITSSQTPKQIANGPSNRNNENNKNNTTTKIDKPMDTEEEKKNTKKKGLFNLFRRNKTKENEAANSSKSAPVEGATNSSSNNQLVVANKSNTALATTSNSLVHSANSSSALVNKNSGDPYDYSTAIVAAEKRNNRPVKMEVKTETNGPITTTITEITRPDGTVERMVMRTGIPGPDPKKKLLLTNGNDHEINLLTNGEKQNQKQLTHDSSRDKKLLTTDANKNKKTARLASGTTTQKKKQSNKPLALENGNSNKKSAKLALLTN